MTKQRRSVLQRVTAWLCLLGGGLLILAAVAFTATAIYEWNVPPTDMHLPGLLTALMMLYAAPIGSILLALAALMRIGTSIAHRRRTANDIS